MIVWEVIEEDMVIGMVVVDDMIEIHAVEEWEIEWGEEEDIVTVIQEMKMTGEMVVVVQMMVEVGDVVVVVEEVLEE